MCTLSPRTTAAQTTLTASLDRKDVSPAPLPGEQFMLGSVNAE